MQVKRSLGDFKGAGYNKGRPVLVQGLWVLTSTIMVEKPWCPSFLRVGILRRFGATIGVGVKIRHGVRVHWPWKLTIGNNVWIGTDAWLLNLEPISIGSDSCISQGAFLCTGSHDWRSPTFEFDNAPINVKEGAWIAARATILRGVTIGAGAVVGATALVVQDVPDGGHALAAKSEVRTRDQ